MEKYYASDKEGLCGILKGLTAIYSHGKILRFNSDFACPISPGNNMQRSVRKWPTLLVGTFAPLLFTASCSGSAGQEGIRVSLPLGARSLEQNWTVQELEPGLVYHVVDRGTARGFNHHWRLRSSPLFTRDEESAAAVCLKNAGAGAIEAQQFRVPGTRHETYSVLASSELGSRDQAWASVISASDCSLVLESVSENPASTDALWHAAIIEIDPEEFEGELRLALADGVVAGRRTVPQMARESGAVAAVNGSFFVMRDEDGVVGDVTGTAVLGGKLLSEAIRGRTTVIIENYPKLALRFDSSPMPVMLNWSDGVSTEIDGVNRAIGLIRNCGNLGDQPNEQAAHDVTCTDSGELVLLTPEAGFGPPDNAAVFELNLEGRLSVSSRMAHSTGRFTYLVATGDRIAELSERIDIVDSVSVRTGFESARPDTDALSGGPLLLLSGVEVFNEASEGWTIAQSNTPARRDEMHRWINLRNPRTAIGQREDGTILIVVIDGRQPDRSVGATIDELRAVMASLGAVDAINLDGGGSSTLALEGELSNIPSDATGARPVGDALMLFSGKTNRMAK